MKFLRNSKKVLIHFLLMAMLFNSAGYYILYEFQKYMIKKEMKAMIRMNPSSYIILKIDDAGNDQDFQRIHSKEFRYKKEMYDIVREMKKGNSTTFICIHDTKESRLMAGLQRETQNKRLFSMVQNIILFFVSLPSGDLVPVRFAELTFPDFKVHLPSPVLKHWSPPPERS